MGAQETLLVELENAISSASSEKRIETLRRVTDLFLNDSEHLSEEQIDLFDDVLGHLINRMETKAIAELGGKLAPVDNAPIAVIRRLARDDEIVVAGPVLSRSRRLTTDDLVEIAGTKSQQHLLAISGRDKLEETLTDKLIERGDRKVVHRLAANSGARFSEAGFSTMVKNAEMDAGLAEKIGLRLDLPMPLLHELLVKATEAARSRLVSQARPEIRDEIRQVLSRISSEVSREAAAPRDFTRAREAILRMQDEGRLTEAALFEFARTRRYEQMVAALAAMCSASIELIAPLMKSERSDGLLIPCKAAGLNWTTVSEILGNRFVHHTVSDAELAKCQEQFLNLSQASAQRTLRFWQVRTATQRSAG
jgi:uncharacterized protein (DUF2336 family)